MKRIYDFIKNAGIYYLATMDGDKPHVRPFGTINIFEGKLYIQTGIRKEVSKQIHKNPHVEICATSKDGTKWIRLSGILKDDKRVEAKKDMLDHYPELRSMYNENDDNTEVFYFESGECVFCSFTDKPELIKI